MLSLVRLSINYFSEVTELIKWKKQNLNLWPLTHHTLYFPLVLCCHLPFFSIELEELSLNTTYVCSSGHITSSFQICFGGLLG